MNNFYIQLSDDSLPIENINNKNSEIISEKILIDILKLDGTFTFIVNRENFEYYKDFNTIGDHFDCNIVLVNDSNIDYYKDKQLKNVYLFINDEDKFFNNFIKIVDNTVGYIEFKFKDFSNYDINKLSIELEKISDYITKIIDKKPYIKNLTSFFVKEKFNKFGENDFFISPSGDIYSHPSFYYSNSNVKISTIYDFKFNGYIYSPHLLCINCETFYCDRNIYSNKINTGEYKAPATNSCALTSLLSKYSKNIFNSFMKKQIVEYEDLDKVDSFDAEIFYKNFLQKKCICNKIKGIDFYDRRTKGCR